MNKMFKYKVKMRHPIYVIVGHGLLDDKTETGYKFKEEVIELPDSPKFADPKDLIGKKVQWRYETHGNYETWEIIEAKLI